MLILQEQIQEVHDRLQYWGKEVKELETIGNLEEIADVYQEARGQISLCLNELECLQGELLKQTASKNGL